MKSEATERGDLTPDTPPPSSGDDREATDAHIEQQLRDHGVRLGRGGIAPAVFYPALALVVIVSIVAVIWPGGTETVLVDTVQRIIVADFGWFYILAIAIFVAVALFIAVSPFGRVVIGRAGDKPEFSLPSWFAMLFAAGMGIGLVFYGVAEPLSFATVDAKPPAAEDPAQRSLLAMAQTFVHWGVHPWAVYVIIGLSLALAIHKRGRPVSIRWALEPLLGERVKGPIGDVIDVLAILGTIFGVATSLGLGVQQIGAGLAKMGVVDQPTTPLLIGLIVVITVLATASVISGLGKGIKWLSNINLGLAGVLLIAVLVLGPTLFIFRNMIESLGVYLGNVLPMTFDSAAYTGKAGADWQASWSVFYWGWWMSWAPFVGVFIARISRGRTVREFVIGALLVPMAVAVVWFSVLGGTAIYREMFGDGGLVTGDTVVAENALFDMLEGLPLGSVLSVIAIVLVAIFFITSSDSGSLVVDMLASGGHPDPPTWSRVVWAVTEGVIAIALLIAGGLGALQAGAIATALPFSIVLLAMAVALLKALSGDLRLLRRRELDDRRRLFQEEFTDHLEENFDKHFGSSVDERIDYALNRTRGADRPHLPRPGGRAGRKPPKPPRTGRR